MNQSTRAKRAKKPVKPRPDFPLFPHATGRWAKKVRGKFCYFGKVSDDPKGEQALTKWLKEKDELLAGRTPRGDRVGLTVKDLCNRFLAAKEGQRDAGDIRSRTFDDYFATCSILIGAFGATRLVDDLAVDDFESLRASLAKKRNPNTLGNEVTRIRVVFKYGFDAGLYDKSIRFGPTFKRPSKRILRETRDSKGPKLFDAKQLKAVIDTAEQPLKAMILLGVNCGFGNTDCGMLPLAKVDLDSGWIEFPRPKTAIKRRCPLWPETIKAIKEMMATRPAPKNESHRGLLFITKYGGAWAKETRDNPITKEFRKTLDELELHRPGLGFYALRHTFETIAGETGDQVAVDHIMGHADQSMAAHYRERISDDRLKSVVKHVRAWLFGKSCAR